ncbi:MAG: hypothetical protein V5A27_11915, partial [Halapricum sp.]
PHGLRFDSGRRPMAVQARRTDVTATVTLWVPLDASGDLTSAVEAVLGDVERVEATDVYDVTEVQPRSTDIRVTATVGLQTTLPAETDRAREHLDEGFGVMDVSSCRVNGEA